MNSFLISFGAASCLALGASIGAPGAVEAFTGETTATSLVLALGAAFGPTSIVALYLYGGRKDAFGNVAFALCAIGVALFAGVAFTLNLAVFHLEPAPADALLAGLTGTVLKLCGLVFVVGAVLFGIGMLRARVLNPVPVVGFLLGVPALAVFANLPDGPVGSLVHVALGLSIVALGTQMLTARARSVAR